jgi:hypothetical protein
LNEVIKNMHLALVVGSKNPIADVSVDIYRFIFRKPKQTKQQLLLEFWDQLPEQKKSLDEIIQYLLGTSKIQVVDGNKYEIKP